MKQKFTLQRTEVFKIGIIDHTKAEDMIVFNIDQTILFTLYECFP